MKTFVLPDLGEGLQEAEVVSWHVSAGDRVIADQPLLAVETDKAVVDLPAPWPGTVVKLHVAPGMVVAKGAPLADFDADGGKDDAGAIVGELQRRSRPTAVHERGALGERSAQDRPIKAVPAARQLARHFGIDLAKIAGTGPDGAITRADVEAAQAARSAWEPLRGARRAMARNMTRAHAEVATTNVTDEAVLANWAEDENVSLRLIRAMVVACRQEKGLNAWYDSSRQARMVHSRIDLGIAMNTDEGLFVPVLRDAASLAPEGVRVEFERLKAAVASRKISPGAMRGQTITLSNFGMVGGRHAVLVIMPPQVAILGAGRIAREPKFVDGEIRACRVLPLSLTFDHRAVTGTEATRFLMAVVRDLEK